jgi:hypothetical protein
MGAGLGRGANPLGAAAGEAKLDGAGFAWGDAAVADGGAAGPPGRWALGTPGIRTAGIPIMVRPIPAGPVGAGAVPVAMGGAALAGAPENPEE